MIKKLAWLLCTIVATNVCGQSHHIFVGGGLGLGREKILGAINKPTFNFNIRSGYEFAFLEMPFIRVGVRTYIDYTMGVRPVGLETLIASLLGVNLDMNAHYLINNDVGIGAFFGLGVGYGSYQNTIVATTDDLPLIQGTTGIINVGISSVFYQNHRIEIGSKIPFSDLYTSQGKVDLRNYYFLLQYDYVF